MHLCEFYGKLDGCPESCEWGKTEDGTMAWDKM